jgi:hypothetical protein
LLLLPHSARASSGVAWPYTAKPAHWSIIARIVAGASIGNPVLLPRRVGTGSASAQLMAAVGQTLDR